MKRTLLIGIGAAIALGAMATQKAPDVVPEFYSYKISPDGRYILSRTGGVTDLLDTETGEVSELGDFDPGNGNCMSDDGRVIVGIGETPVLFIDGKQVSLEGLMVDLRLTTLGFNGVSADGRRIVGYATNPESTETMSVPMFIDINDDGTLGELNYLPYPSSDWLGKEPMYVYCTNVSSDGRIIAGQMKDNTGFTVEPLIFRQASDGSWSHSRPAEKLINPDNLPLPVFPGDFTMPAPESKDFMTPEQLAAYQAAMDAWEASGFQQDLFPAETDFMTDEEAMAYEKALKEYNEAAEKYNLEFEAYFENFEKIVGQSVFFMQNGQTMDASGTLLAMAAEVEKADSAGMEGDFPMTEVSYPLYTYDIAAGELTEIGGTSDGKWPIPDQILSDGTIIANTPLPNPFAAEQLPPQAYVIAPGEKAFTPLEDYMEKFNSEGAAWLRKEFSKNVLVAIDYDTMEEKYLDLVMTGHPVVSDDWSVVSGGVLAYYYSEAYSYESYVIYGTPYSGVSTISPDASIASRRYYDLNGIETMNPEGGIYVEQTLYTDGRVETRKVAGPRR